MLGAHFDYIFGRAAQVLIPTFENLIAIGVWHSLVVRMVRDHEAAGSNPVTPTSGKLPPPIIGGVRRKSLPYHTTAKLGYNGVRSTISSVHNGLQLWALDFFMKDLSSPKILTTPPKSSKKQEKAAKIEPYFKKGLDFFVEV